MEPLSGILPSQVPAPTLEKLPLKAAYSAIVSVPLDTEE